MITITKFMKTAVVAVALSFIGVLSMNAQDSDSSAVSVDAGVDLYSRYVWRGAQFGSGPAVQPWVELGAGGFTLGSWGSYQFGDEESQEIDLYAGYEFGFGLGIGVTDYGFPAGGAADFFDYSDTTGSHDLEVALSYTISEDIPLSITAGYFFAGSVMKESIYAELGYSIGNVSLFAGAGNEGYTTDGEFMLVNVGVAASKDIEVTDSFTLPLVGSLIVNPDAKAAYLVVGVSF